MVIRDLARNGLKSEQCKSLVESRFAQSIAIPGTFFSSQAEEIAQACWKMARYFHLGGRLIAFGNGAWATDAQHVSVEFVHPVIVGKRALPAIALTNDSALLSGLRAGGSDGLPFSRQLRLLARAHDIALGFSMDGVEANILAAFSEAKEKGLLTLGLTGRDGGQMAQAGLDFCFSVPSDDPLVVQETHETLYHILWELVHVFFEHEGLLA
jgi:D-sedoheptulose 7-phosphate isomerase